MKNRNLILASIVAASLVLSTVALTAPTITAQPSGNSTAQSGQLDENDERPSVQFKLNRKYHDYEDGVFKVRAGAGSHVAPLTIFMPNHAEIKVGETVLFYNPTKVSEPHTVTFIMDNTTFGDFAAPFLIDNQTTITPAVPNANAEPIIAPGPPDKNVIVALNNRSFSPTVVDSAGQVTYLQPNGNYTVTGTEKYINSGWIWPKGLSPPGLAPIDSFSLTFEKVGTYNYICVVHPWMTGDVVVR